MRPPQQLEKQGSFIYILKSSASLYKSSGSQFLRTMTGIQSGPYTFDESMFFLTFLPILGVIEILCSFRLVLEGQACKGMPESSRLEFIEKRLAKNFALSDTEEFCTKFCKVCHFSDDTNLICLNQKLHTCEDGGAHLRIFFWHLLMNLKTFIY